MTASSLALSFREKSRRQIGNKALVRKQQAIAFAQGQTSQG
ncbi:hypothetical protein [Salinivibrio kushneri]|uniref:Uncharacterized protein n=1 Tax=Salinivibrio kushneri TaxID=1908198 RepID=A0AA47KMI6_9GAMM|nr:hypothetical protein [Salinivibrio kushneri]WBA09656.1 hypothetical protein N8M53_05530 [Salinivibrio kushneri]